MKLIQFCAIVITSYFLLSCVTSQQGTVSFRKDHAFVGEPYRKLLKEKGPPDAKVDLPSGEEVWIYRGKNLNHSTASQDPENVSFTISKEGVISDVKADGN